MNLNLRSIFLCLSVCIASFAHAQKIGDPYPSSLELIIAGINSHETQDYKTAISKYQLVLTGDSLYDLALYEKAYSCVSDGQYEKTVEVTKLCLEYPNPYHFEAMVLQGSAYEKMEKWEEAEATFNLMVEKFPNFHRSYFERATYYLTAKKYDLALRDANKALELNLFHARSHRLIGILAAETNQPALAVMALYMGVLTENVDVNNTLAVLTTIEQIGGDNYEKTYDVNPELTEYSGILENINQIIRSKAPLSASYKSKVKSNYNYMRVLQAICEKLPAKLNTEDKMLKFYGDFYKYVWDNNLFAGLVYQPLREFDSKDIQSAFKKNQKKVQDFNVKSRKFMDDRSEMRDYKIGDKTIKGHYYVFGDNTVGIGDIVNNTPNGNWCYFHTNGMVSAIGKLDMNTQVGKWTYYHENGRLKSEIEFNSTGKYNGVKSDYSALGVLSTATEYTNGNYDGFVKNYRWNGSIESEYEVRNNSLVGFLKLYDEHGNLSSLVEIRNNERGGSYKEFYPDGALYVEGTNEKGEFNGDYKVYYHDGSQRVVGSWKNGKRAGEWKWFHPNGQLQSSINYKDGNAEGESIDYSDDGMPHIKSNYKADKLEGLQSYYDRFGNVYSEWTFKAGKLKSTKYFNYDGSVLADNQFESRKFVAKDYNEFRKLSSEGAYENELAEGEWIYYAANGSMTSKAKFVNGKKEGKATYYHPNGKVSGEYNYSHGELDGYYRKYFEDGTLREDGYYKMGQPHGYFRFMNSDGKLSETKFFWNGEVNGWNTDYDVNEKVFTRMYFNFGLNEITESYDRNGNLINRSETPQGNGVRKFYGEGNFVRIETEIRNGQFYSGFKSYTNTGVPLETRDSKYGMSHGKVEVLYPTGVKSITGKYKFGERDSVWNYYSENGELKRSITFKEDETNGSEIRYEENGKKSSERMLKDGDLNGYIYYYGNDGSVGARIYCTDDIFISYSYLGKDGKYVPEIELMDNGHVVCYYQNGKKSLEFTLVNGKYDKEYRRYDIDGKILVQSDYVDGIEQGVSKDYYFNGKLKWEEDHLNGKLNGVSKVYYPNGKLCAEYVYKDGARNGAASFYDKNGKLILKGEYVNDYFIEK